MLPAYGLYGHIRNNNIKSMLLLLGFAFLITLLWYAGCLYIAANGARSRTMATSMLDALTLARQTWFVPASIVAVWFTIAYCFHGAMIRAGTGATTVTRRDEPRLFNIVETLAITAGLPLPKIEIMESDALNAYASGLSEHDATIAVTRGLLDNLDDRELATVIAHEFTHIKNRDVRLMVVATIFAGMITLIGEFMVRIFFSDRGSSSDNSSSARDGRLAFVAIGLALVAYVFSLVLQFALSRSREYLADAGAVELTKDPDALIAALRKLDQGSATVDVPQSMQAMMIAASGSGEGDLFSTHPSVDARVERLVRFAGGRDIPVAADEEPALQAA